MGKYVKTVDRKDNVEFEEALNETGFSIFNYTLSLVSLLIFFSYCCIAFNATIFVSASACELQTTVVQKGLLAATPLIALVFASHIWGYLADRHGRRYMLLWSLSSSAFINALTAFSPNWIALLCGSFIGSCLASGLLPLSLAYLSECTPATYRKAVVILNNSMSVIPTGIFAMASLPVLPLQFSYYIEFLNIYFNSWRLLFLLFSVPNLISLFLLLFYPESPKFVLSTGDRDKAITILRIIHKINNPWRHTHYEPKNIYLNESSATANTNSILAKIGSLYKPPFLKHTLILSVLFICMCFQGTSFFVWSPTILSKYMDSLGGRTNHTDQSVCTMITYTEVVVNQPAFEQVCTFNVTSAQVILAAGGIVTVLNVIVSILVTKVSRKSIVAILFAVSGIATLCINFSRSSLLSTALITLTLLVLINLGVLPAIVLSLYPTSLRATATGLQLSTARVGGVVGTQLLNLLLTTSCEAAFYLFGGVSCFAAVVTLFLPTKLDEEKLENTKPTNINNY